MLFESNLPDGRRVVFRPIERDDKELLVHGFERLSPQSRYRRFFRAIDHLSERQLSYLTEVDGEDHVAWVALLPDEQVETRGAGVARWIRLKDDPHSAEGAVTVVDSLHGMGIGTTLLHLVAREAITHGIRNFKAWVMGENHQVQAMLTELGAQPGGTWEAGALEMTVPLPEDPADLDATPAPLILKAVAEGRLAGRLGPDARGTHFLSPEAATDQPMSP